MSEIAKLLGGGGGRRTEVLTEDMKKELQVVDLNSEKGIKPPEPRRAVIPQEDPSRFNQAIKALSSPAGQRFLGNMAKAFTQNNPNTAGTILGNAGIQQAEGRAIQNFASRLLAGEDVGEISGMDVGGISPQGIAQAQQMASTQEQGDRADRQLDQEDQMLQLRNRSLALEEDIQGFNEEVFTFEQGMEEDELARRQRLLEIEEANAPFERRLMRARANMLQTEVELLSSAGEGGIENMNPEQKNELFQNTEAVVELLNVQAEPLEEQLSNTRASYNRLDNPNSERGQRMQEEIEYLNNRLATIRQSQVQAFQQLGNLTGIDVDEEMFEGQETPVVAPSENAEGEESWTDWFKNLFSRSRAGQAMQNESNAEPGSLGNPIQAPEGTSPEDFAEFFEQQEPNTIGSYNGRMYKKTEDGDLVEL